MPLSARKVETARPGKYTDEKGLILVVKRSGTRSWVFRYQIKGRRRDMGLGSWPEVTLAMARAKALEARRAIASGQDPLAEKRKTAIHSFREAALALIEAKRSGWRNEKHASQWTATLTQYAFPRLGALDVAGVTTEAVLEVLRPIWGTKPETASRVRQRIEAVLDYASALGVRNGDNPARWRGHLERLLPQPSKVRAVVHHPALDWREMPEFMAELCARGGTAARALAFAILTASRSGEVRGARWAEIDRHAGIWIIPATRMKAGKEHRVPLSAPALHLLGPQGNPQALVFPGSLSPSKPMSDMALSAVLKRMGRTGITVHGFRSSFRDWAGETTHYPREVIEAALAHRLKDKAEAAYARGDLFLKRRALMDDWADYLAHSGTR